MHRTIAVVLLLATQVAAQNGPPRSVEVFGQAGRTRIGGDEGAGPGVASYGSTIHVPLWGKWGLDFSAAAARQPASNEPPHYFAVRHLMITPALVRRFGNRRVYGFTGFGVGVQADRSVSQWPYYSGDPPRVEGIARGTRTDSGMVLLGRGGVVWNPWSHLLLRGDIEASFRFVVPNLTARAGVGWRF